MLSYLLFGEFPSFPYLDWIDTFPFELVPIFCTVSAILAFFKAFKDELALKNAGTPKKFREVIFQAAITMGVIIFLNGIFIWLTIQGFLDLTLLWLLIVLFLFWRMFATWLIWDTTWDASQLDWEKRQHPTRNENERQRRRYIVNHSSEAERKIDDARGQIRRWGQKMPEKKYGIGISLGMH